MPPESIDDGLSRNVYAFGFTSLFNDISTEMAYWVIPAFLVSIGAGPAQLGIIEGIAESVASIAKLLAGYLADRMPQRKPLVVAGYAVANITKPFLGLASLWWHVLIVRFFDRVSKGLRSVPRDVMLAESVRKERLGAGFGLLQTMDSAGAVLGPLIAIVLLPRIGLRNVFWAAAVPGALAVLTVWFAIREPRHTIPGALQSRAGRTLRHFGFRGLPASFYYLIVAVSLFSLGNSSDMFLVLRAQNLGIAARNAPLLGLVFNSTYTLAAWPFGKLSDRYSKPAVAAAGYLVFAATYLSFAAGASLSLIWVSMAIYGCYYALTEPVLRALVGASVEPQLRGRAFGIFAFATSLATLVSSIAAGELWQRYGAAVPFYFSAALATVAALMLVGLSAFQAGRKGVERQRA
ncbi:MAG: MFS transporter [Acidobacteria bacterium]|nr:MFS transporter [Acidobacteriota bacterium]